MLTCMCPPPYDKWLGIQCAVFWISRVANGRLFFGKGDGADRIQTKLIVHIDELEISIIEFDVAIHITCYYKTWQYTHIFYKIMSDRQKQKPLNA